MNLSNIVFAEQSPYATLILEHKRPETNRFQESTRDTNISLLKFHSGDPITTVPAAEWSIVNLPDTVPMLPINTVFDQIDLIHEQSPDFRFVGITTVPTVIARPKVMPMPKSVCSKRQRQQQQQQQPNSDEACAVRKSMFEKRPRLPDLPLVSQKPCDNVNGASSSQQSNDLASANTSKVQRGTENDSRFSSVEFPLDVTTIDSNFTQASVVVLQGSSTVDNNRTRNQTILNISKLLNIPDPIVQDVLRDKVNMPKNRDTVAAQWVKSFADSSASQLQRMNESTDNDIATLILSGINTY